jgi:hypothetical protein
VSSIIAGYCFYNIARATTHKATDSDSHVVGVTKDTATTATRTAISRCIFRYALLSGLCKFDKREEFNDDEHEESDDNEPRKISSA